MTNEIDLIPSDYRSEQWRRRALKTLMISCSAIVATSVLGAGAFSHATTRVQLQVTELAAHRELTGQQRSELEALSGRQTELEQQLAVLEGLRGGAAADTMSVTIDRALADHRVWFTRWQFQRAGVLVYEEQAGVESGYFIVVPEDQRHEDNGAWQVETRMMIQGQAVDHAALSEFIDGLFAQPEIVDVRVQKTSRRSYAQMSVVDFDLAIVLNSDVGI